MKKIVLALAVVFSVALVSCGNKQAEAENAAEGVEDVVVEEAAEVDTLVDSAAADTVVVEEAAAEVQ